VAKSAIAQKALYVRALALRTQQLAGRGDRVDPGGHESVEAMRGAIQRSELAASYLATVRRYFDLHIDLLQAAGRVRRRVRDERARPCRTLWTVWPSPASKIQKASIRSCCAAAAVQAELNAKRSTARRWRSRTANQSAPRRAVSRDLERLLEQWTEVRARIRSASPAYWNCTPPSRSPSSACRKTLLDADSALVEYHLGGARSYVWVIDRASITVHTLASSTRSRKWRDAITSCSAATSSVTVAERGRLAAGITTTGLGWRLSPGHQSKRASVANGC